MVMTVKERIERFEQLGFGMFIHFGLYSVIGKGEWYKFVYKDTVPASDYEALTDKFDIKKGWAKELVSLAKASGCKYITLTTRHHDGFSLYDTRGLSDYDAPHSKSGRDLIAEFADECHKQGIIPFFYHTLLDWHHPEYNGDFEKYIDYLAASIEILCKNYGEVGGFWFDGMWDKPDANWQLSRIYGIIRTLQPNAMIIDNTGLGHLGEIGNDEIDSVTFERGKPRLVNNSDRPRGGEMCEVLNDHWGHAKSDYSYKSMKEIINTLVDCRVCNCNLLLNIGLTGNGTVATMDKCMFRMLGAWIKDNKSFIYNVKRSDIAAEGAEILEDEKYIYAVIRDVPMQANLAVQRGSAGKTVKVDAPLRYGVWLDSGESIRTKRGEFDVLPFSYGESRTVRIARFRK